MTRVRSERLSHYAIAVVPDSAEDSTSTFRPDLADWNYFEDWLQRERRLLLSDVAHQQ